MPDLTFPTPQGFEPPEHTAGDDTFQAMATFKIVGDDGNELQLVDIEGYQIGDEDTEGDTDSAAQADQASDQGALQANMQNAGSAASAEANTGPPASFASQMGQKFRAATGKK